MAKWGEIKCPRCEELEAQITAMDEGLTAVHMAGYLDGKKAAEAKLAKAVEQEMARVCNAYAKDGNMIAATAIHDAWLCVQRTLAELTGGKDD